MAGALPTVFLSYSHKDEAWKDSLKPHLGLLVQQDRLSVWDDRRIDPGATWFDEIQAAMARASVAICLISPDYLASPFCVKEEIPYLLRRRAEEGMLLIPILVRACAWKEVPWLLPIQMTPRDGRALAQFAAGDQDAILAQVAELVAGFLRQGPIPPRREKPSRTHDISRLPASGSEAIARSTELRELDANWASRTTKIVWLIGDGGTGKTTLAARWMDAARSRGWPDMEYAYTWSFYSQGTGEKVTSSDDFTRAALRWVGDANPDAGSLWDRGERLAGILGKQRGVLVLDGIEPLQGTPGSDLSNLKDLGLAALLGRLSRSNTGMCIVTSRLPPPDDIARRRGVCAIDLEPLGVDGARALLRISGMRGTDSELAALGQLVGTQCLAVSLISHWAQLTADSDARVAREILSEKGHEIDTGWIIDSILATADPDEAQFARLFGLLDRPLDSQTQAALLAPPAIPELNELLVGLNESKLNSIVLRLRRKGILLPRSEHTPHEIDAHPIVRQHLDITLQRRSMGAWKQGRSRICSHLLQSSPRLPETWDQMAPIYAAIPHGVAAGRAREMVQIYKDRVIQDLTFFSMKMLGAAEADLAAVTSFFETPWTKVRDDVPLVDAAFLLGEAGYRLMATGRQTEALDVMCTAYDAYTKVGIQGIRGAQASADNMASLLIGLGRLDSAESWARLSLKLGDSMASHGLFAGLKGPRLYLAMIAFERGNLDLAREWFDDAKEKQAKEDHRFHGLYGSAEFEYGDLLIRLGDSREALRAANYSIKICKAENWRLDLAFAHLARASALEGTKEPGAAIEEYAKAIDLFRVAGSPPALSLALVRRASFQASQEISVSLDDLEEATDIILRGQFLLYEVELQLLRAKVLSNTTDRANALKRAHEIVEATGARRYIEALRQANGTIAD